MCLYAMRRVLLHVCFMLCPAVSGSPRRLHEIAAKENMFSGRVLATSAVAVAVRCARTRVDAPCCAALQPVVPCCNRDQVYMDESGYIDLSRHVSGMSAKKLSDRFVAELTRACRRNADNVFTLPQVPPQHVATQYNTLRRSAISLPSLSSIPSSGRSPRP